MGQEEPSGGQNAAQQQTPNQNMTPEQRAAATRAFLGLGPEPDKAAAARGTPLYKKNCAFCHGPQARGATGPSLITSDEVLNDDHGERLTPFLKKGRPENGMPAFAALSRNQLMDISEFLHLQVEEVANRGTYHVLNILVGNAAKGQAYVAAHCMSCHSAEDVCAHRQCNFRSARAAAAWLDLADAPGRRSAGDYRNRDDAGRRYDGRACHAGERFSHYAGGPRGPDACDRSRAASCKYR